MKVVEFLEELLGAGLFGRYGIESDFVGVVAIGGVVGSDAGVASFFELGLLGAGYAYFAGAV